MTVKKAIEGLDFLIKDKRQLKTEMIDSVPASPDQNGIVSRFDRAMGTLLQ